ncbi:MAG: gliding motility lipoprotein GldH [Bacteroidales bacterium]
MRTKTKKRNNFLSYLIKGMLCILFICFAYACQPKEVFFQYHSFDQMQWSRKDTIVFNEQFSDSLKKYPIVLETRKDVKYPYKDLWIEVKIMDNDSVCMQTDTIHLFLNDHNGKPIGKGFGTLYQQSDTIFPDFRPLNSSAKNFRIRHLMEDEYLYGISDIGIHTDTEL